MKSPVCTMVPRGVLMAQPMPSATLWQTLKKLRSKGPSSRECAVSTSIQRTRSAMPISSTRPLAMARVNLVP